MGQPFTLIEGGKMLYSKSPYFTVLLPNKILLHTYSAENIRM